MQQAGSIIYDAYLKFASCWQQSSRKKKALVFVGVYTIVFLTAFLIAYSPFLWDSKTFLWSHDGRSLYFPCLVYIGRVLRRIVLNLWDGKFSIPMFDICAGSGGDDVIGFLSSLGQTDPLLLLSVFVPTRYSEYLYAFLAIFRVYLAGLSFSFLCFYFRKRALHTLIGSMVYCFNGYAIIFAMRHVFYINPMILLPLLTVGIDKILKKEKPYLFIFAMFYAALCGYYHLYMMTIMLAIYGVVRFFDVYKENRFKKFLTFVGGGVSGYLLGIGLAAIIFMPALAQFFYSARSGAVYYPGAYSWSYCRTLLMRLITPPGDQNCMAFAAIVLFALTLMFFSKGKRTLKILTVIAFAFLLTSIGGLVMNGFQYPSNRWTFGLVLVAAYIVVEMLPELLELTRKQQVMCFIVLVFSAVVFFATTVGRKMKYVSAGVIFLALTLLVLTMFKETAEQTKRRVFSGCLCLLLVIVNVGVYGVYRFSTDFANYAGEFAQRGYETELIEGAIERELRPYLSNAPKGRGDGLRFSRNVGLVWQMPGMITFSPTINGHVVNFWQMIESAGTSHSFNIVSTEQKTIANTLLSVKYQVESEKTLGYIPYGYAQIKKTKNDNLIYENKYALPWGYTYDHAISYSQLHNLNGVTRQEAMLQAIALDEEVTSGAKWDGVQFDIKKLPYKVECKGCTWKNGMLVVSKPNATVTLTFNMSANVEGYVRLNQFNFNNSRLSAFSAIQFQVKCEDILKKAMLTPHLFTWYYGSENYLFYLGYSDHARNSVTITFPQKGTFKLKNIELFALPMDNYSARVEAMRAEPLENIKWGTNSLSGTVDLSKDKILCVSVPYSKGWSATVDGKKAEILRGNYMFMALPLKAGHHEVKFSYCTPGLKLGAVLSALSACIVAGMFMRDRRRRKNVG